MSPLPIHGEVARSAGGAGRHLHWPDCHNTRDLGGISLRGGVTRTGVLVRSDDIGHLNAAGREAMVAYGVTTVIDLLSDSERNGTFDHRYPLPPIERVTVSGLNYVHRPLVDDAALKRLGEAANMYERYRVMLSTRQEAFRDIFTSIAAAEGGVVFHCFAGKDRTGLVAALLLGIAGVAEDNIADDFAETDVQLASQYQVWIENATLDKQQEVRDDLRCPRERILGVLDFVGSKWGGVDSYLEASGVTPDDIDRLAARLE